MILEYGHIIKETDTSITFKIDDQTRVISIPRSQIFETNPAKEKGRVEIGWLFAGHNGLRRFTQPVQSKARGKTIWLQFDCHHEKPKAIRFWFADGAKIHIPRKHIKSITHSRVEIDTKWALFDRLTCYETEAPCPMKP